MSRSDRMQINLRVDPELRAIIDQLRREEDPIPSISEVVRQALFEKAARKGVKRVRRGEPRDHAPG